MLLAGIRAKGLALVIRHSGVGIRQVELQLAVVAGLGRQRIQVFQRGLGEQAPGFHGPRQRRDGIVHLEHEGVGQLAHALEVSLGTLALRVRDASLAQRQGDAAQQRHQHQSRCGDLQPAPPEKFARPVSELIATCADGLAAQITAQVVGEPLHRGITLAGLLAQRAQANGVQVLRQARRVGCEIPEHYARRDGLGLADLADGVLRGIEPAAVRTAS